MCIYAFPETIACFSSLPNALRKFKAPRVWKRHLKRKHLTSSISSISITSTIK